MYSVGQEKVCVLIERQNISCSCVCFGTFEQLHLPVQLSLWHSSSVDAGNNLYKRKDPNIHTKPDVYKIVKKAFTMHSEFSLKQSLLFFLREIERKECPPSLCLLTES